MVVAAIIQARMTSTRLPGKVLADFNGRPMLDYMLARVRRASRLDSVWVATTTNTTDDPVAELCGGLGLPVFRGGEADVLERYAGAAAAAEADIVVRLTADCPLMDPALIDEAIGCFTAGEYDYLSNAIELSYPDGLDIEIFTRAALDQADRKAKLPFHREHVTPYLRTGVYEDVPTGDFLVGRIRAPADFSHLRWTVDTPEDLQRVRSIAAALPDDHGWMDVLSLLTRRPALLHGLAGEAGQVALRPADESDVDLLFEWVNRPESLSNKLVTDGPVSRDAHVTWFKARLSDPDSAIWIGQHGEEPVGQVRLQRRADALEVDIFVVPDTRGRGIGVEMLEAARQEAARRWPGVPLRAKIKPDNWASRRLFAKAGFGGMIVAPDHLVFQRDPARTAA
jgi:spore coat polysaccharide biosynthesis protein SpsF